MHIAQEYSLHLAISLDGTRYKQTDNSEGRLAPGAYAVSVSTGGSTRTVWGEGYISDSQVLFAHGITHILDEILIGKPGVLSGLEDNFRLQIFVKNDGATKNFGKFVFQWFKDAELNSNGKKPNNYETWKRYYLLSQFGRVQFAKALEPSTKKLVKAVQQIAANRAKLLKDPQPSSHEGIINSGTFVEALAGV